MNDDLSDLKISYTEVERLCGLDVDEVFMGGAIGGTFRPGIFQSPRKLFILCLIEFAALILMLVVTLPLGLLVVRDITQSIQDAQTIAHFLGITLGAAFLLLLTWNGYMQIKRKKLQFLGHLLAGVDRHNEVLQALDVLDKLEAAGNSGATMSDRADALEALRITRESLVCALMTERILRENQGLFARRYELFEHIERNLSTLQTLDVKYQADDYSRLLNEALAIGVSVQQDVRRFGSDGFANNPH